MAQVKIQVWYDVSGRIIAIGQPISGYQVIPIGGENQLVLDTEIEEEEIENLHKTYVVDVRERNLLLKR